MAIRTTPFLVIDMQVDSFDRHSALASQHAELSVIDAYQRDYDVILALQCTGSHDAEHHDVAVRYLNGKMARVLSNDEVMNFVSPVTGV